MTKSPLFKQDAKIFKWQDVETFLIRSQYNEILDFVIKQYDIDYAAGKPNFLNRNSCLTIELCQGRNVYAKALNQIIQGVDNTLPLKEAGNKFSEAGTRLEKAKEKLDNFLTEYQSGLNSNKTNPSEKNYKGLLALETALNASKEEFDLATVTFQSAGFQGCLDKFSIEWFLSPRFIYDRKLSLKTSEIPQDLEFNFSTNGLTVGAVIWLYFYERMGIFKILGALLDDYNYKGKYTISGRRKDDKGNDIKYSVLMDMISTLHRVGISSNIRDRICLYQRVLGVSIENKLGVESERNAGFMSTFNRLIEYQLEYYKTKQLAQAIQAQAQAGTIQPRSSVATQTSIRDTINVMQQHFEPLQYGRNQINTFIGIATVHATLCLVNMLKSEIGVPAQYERPEEFIPAAYDILVGAKQSRTINESNRFIIYDNCASYGYRLLTDIETIDINQLSTVSSGSPLDTWLNDVEGLVEGYRNAYSAVPEKVEAIV